jgi:hypothetical protein
MTGGRIPILKNIMETSNMKKILVVIFILLTGWTFANADVYIKIKTHTDSYYDSGVIMPAEDSIEEMWIGDEKIVFITGRGLLHFLPSENQTEIYDLENNLVSIIFPKKKIYAQSPLPLDMSKLLTSQYYSRLQRFKIKGIVKKTDETKKVGEWNCKKYELETWIMYEGIRPVEKYISIWMTTEVPFDLDMYGKAAANERKLRDLRYDDDLLSEWNKIKGCQIALEMTSYYRGVARRYYEEVVEISEKNPPDGIYSVPPGYTKKERLSGQDLR